MIRTVMDMAKRAVVKDDNTREDPRPLNDEESDIVMGILLREVSRLQIQSEIHQGLILALGDSLGMAGFDDAVERQRHADVEDAINRHSRAFESTFPGEFDDEEVDD